MNSKPPSLRPRTLAQLSTLSWLPERYRQVFDSFVSCSQAELELTLRDWFRRDLFALLTLGLNRLDVAHPWLYARCQEIQASPDGHLDLWARGHYKSTLQTFGKTLQDILASHGEDPLPHWDLGHEPTFVIFSHTRPIAKAFLRQIKVELQRNSLLKSLYPDILYESPERQSPRWSEDAGLVVKRHANPKEATLEAHGLVDGQPTSRHYSVMIYDDVVVRDSVSTPEMIAKTTEAWELSLNLGDSNPRKRYVGTRWHFADSYRTMMEREAAIPRIHPATEDGTLTGPPVLLTPEELRQKVREMGPYTASAQLLLDPTVDSKQRFLRAWFEHRFDREREGWSAMNRVLLCDPASGKKASDYTAMAVLGLGSDLNYYVLDLLRDRLTLQQRASEFLRLHRKWRPMLTGYESYGLQADIAYLQERMDREGYRFDVTEMKGKLSKFDRVNRLIPVAADGRLWFPDAIMRTNADGKLEDLVELTIEQEFLAWPVPAYDDCVDAISRVFDLEPAFPMPAVPDHPDDRYARARRRAGSWQSA